MAVLSPPGSFLFLEEKGAYWSPVHLSIQQTLMEVSACQIPGWSSWGRPAGMTCKPSVLVGRSYSEVGRSYSVQLVEVTSVGRSAEGRQDA